MRTHCKHCGTLCPSSDPFEGFCCGGCRGVYGLIHEAGLEDYYVLQDRAGRPIDRLRDDASERLSLDAIMERSELTERGRSVALYVSGMTCRGCSWLIERIAKTSEGILSVAVSLTSGRLEIEWSEGFDFDQFQAELGRFGYRLSDRSIAGLNFSPLMLRFILSSLFGVNGLIIVLLRSFQVAPTLDGLFSLLLMANLLLLFLIGSAVYLRPAWDGLRIRHFHSDLVPAAINSLVFGLSLLEVVAAASELVFTIGFIILVPAFLSARILADRYQLWREQAQHAS